jgi:hypothetical protein
LWPNLYIDLRFFSTERIAPCAKPPNARTTLRFCIVLNSLIKKGAQFFISVPFGLFSGGKHLTALVILQLLRTNPSGMCLSYDPVASPNFNKEAKSKSPA